MCPVFAQDELQQARHAGPLQALRALARVHDDLEEFGFLDDRHGADNALLEEKRERVSTRLRTT
jgi:hypothetical protein